MIISKPDISIVVPLYNKGHYIANTLNSILAQSFKNFEVIVINDGSTDEGPDIVKKYLLNDSRIRLISQYNSGVSAARNRGIAEAKSDIIAFLDADDVWKPCFLETIITLISSFPQAGAYSTSFAIVYPSGKVTIPDFSGIPEAPWEGIIPNYFRAALSVAICNSSNTAVPKSIFSKVGLFPEGSPIGEDLDLWARIALEFPIAFSTKVCSKYHLNASESTIKADNFYLRKNRPVVNTLKKAISEGACRPHLVEDIYNYIAYRQIKDSRICLIHTKDKKRARKLLQNGQPTKLKLQLAKITTLILTFLPISITKKLFKAKQLFK